MELLQTTEPALRRTLDDKASCYSVLELFDPAKPKKIREVLSVTGEVRRLQEAVYRRLLLRKLFPSDCSHGGIRGRSIKTNAAVHRNARFVFKADISDFYPSIHYSRVYRLFVHQLGCCPDVARLLTQLCTYNSHLALGLVTSPIIADRMLQRVDARIAALCKSMGLVYSRFVDDVTISGPYSLQSSGIESSILEIMKDDGFKLKASKLEFGSISDVTITGLRLEDGALDVGRAYLRELNRQLDDAESLSVDGPFAGPYFSANQIRGRVLFVSWINRGRRDRLMARFRRINWVRVQRNARERGYVCCRKTLKEKQPSELLMTSTVSSRDSSGIQIAAH